MNTRNRLLAAAFNCMAPAPSLICMIEDEGGSGGAGGDGGDDGGEPKSPVVDPKQLANMVNSAVTAQLKRVDFAGMISTNIASAMEGFKPAEPEPEPEGDKKLSPEAIELRKLKAEQDKIRSKMEETTAQAEAEKNKARTQAERSALTTELRKNGVDDARIDGAVALLYLDKKRIRRDDEDKISMSFTRDWGEELVPIDKGIVEYLGSDSGKVFMPPVDVSGSGNKGGKPVKRKPGQKPTRAELLDKLGKQMMNGG